MTVINELACIYNEVVGRFNVIESNRFYAGVIPFAVFLYKRK